MKYLSELLTDEVSAAFKEAGYREEAGKVSVSNRPDLCEFQCNGAMSLAREYHKAPIKIAEEVAQILSNSKIFSEVNAAAPGFLNMKLSGDYLKDYLACMTAPDYGLKKESSEKIIMDYGGPNVAKPLHIGHLRSAIIGESIKRMGKITGNEVLADIHMGDWGLQMGLIIHELSLRKGDLCYFDPSYDGEYPEEAPFTLSELEEIYPTASKKSKETDGEGNETPEAKEYKEAALLATKELQDGRRGYRALWEHIMKISVADLKANYEKLDVSFDIWKGESDADKYIAPMVENMKEKGLAHESRGALVVDIEEEDDTKEVPPCMILKSDGAALYTTTDLGTLVQRQEDYRPDRIIYVVDKRQGLHFEQVFRCAKKTGIIPKDTRLDFLGFGTMNGPDGGPFKTREGGVMRLESLIKEVNEEMLKKMKESDHDLNPAEEKEAAAIVAMAAIKYGDLSNQATKDYIFDIDKFTSFEGNTGPYILYTVVRIKSILRKYTEQGGDIKDARLSAPKTDDEKALMNKLAMFNSMMDNAFKELAPHRVCAFIYEVANDFNRFYHSTKILTEENETRQKGWIALLVFTKGILETCLDVLGMKAPEKM
ncbi:MAG: arginine--tRNA ligase [Lachnospiraceae bacterium]|nr:arginine--tRNA ligase [Lachnospiraceae bacterium]